MRLHDYLEHLARVTPEAVFAEFGDRRIRYAEADAEANRVANALIACGLAVGDRFAIVSKNCIEYLLLYYGASKAGVAPVPLNYRLAAPEWSYIVNDSEARLLIARGEFVPAIAELREQLPKIEHWIALGADAPGHGAGEIWQSWDEFIAGQPTTPPDREVTDAMDSVDFVDALPRNPTGKILKRELREPYWQGKERRVN